MSLTENQCLNLSSAIYTCFSNKEDWNNFFKDEKLNLKVDISNYPNDLENIKSQYSEIKILIFEAPHADLSLNQEYESIISSIKSLSHGNSFTIIRERVISADEISQHIANKKPDIVHFSGHGLEDGSLSLGKETVKSKFLESLFKLYKNVKCVIFNTCNSEKIADIISPYIDYVISMNNSILDDKAIHFAKNFYSGLAQAYSDSIDIFLTGFVKGIIALTNDDYAQELIPVLKIRYKQAILNLIKRKNAESNIDDFIKILIPYLSTNKLFNEFYHDYSYPIKKDDLNQLVEIIREIKDWNLVKNSYRDTLPENSTIDNSKLNNHATIDDIINILQIKYPFVSDKVPSILDFTKNLAGKFEENSQEYQTIQSWIEEVSSQLNIAISVQPKVERQSTNNQTTFLFIIIFPEDNKFRLEVEFILDENQKFKSQPFDFKELLNIDDEADDYKGIICSSFEEIPAMLDKIIKSFIYDFREKISTLIIEIFLPYKYLGKNLDNEWLIQEENSKNLIPIVLEYNMILHPIERFISNISNFKFQQGWSRFIQVLKSKSNTSSMIGDIEIIQRIDSKNHRKAVVDFSKKIGVKLTSPLSEKEQDFFWRAVLSGGIPLAFWTRFHTHKHINLDAIDCRLTVECLSNNFQQLIDEMYKIRQQAYCKDNPEEDLGYHLGFLCDNPNRIPSLKPLKPF